MQVLIRRSLNLHLSRGGRLAVQGDLGRGGGEMVVGAVGHIIVGAIVTVLVVGKAGGLISGMRRQLESLLTFSSGDPLHLVVVTDSSSRSFVAEKLAGVVSRW